MTARQVNVQDFCRRRLELLADYLDVMVDGNAAVGNQRSPSASRHVTMNRRMPAAVAAERPFTLCSLLLPICIIASSCSSSSGRTESGEQTTSGSTADSIVMERTPCFGTCPAYRVRLSRAGHVHFQSRNAGEVATDTIAVRSFSWLLAEAERIGFYRLPEKIASDPTLCAVYATDHPTVITTIFNDGRTKRVEHYTGCYGPAAEHGRVVQLEALTPFYSAIDSIAGTSRWIRSARDTR